MQIIVSSTNLSALYKATDNTLKKYGDKSTVPENIKGQSALSVLKTIFGDDSFSAYKFHNLCSAYNVEISEDHRKWIDTLGYVKFRDMHNETREYLFAMCIDYLKPVISMSYAELN